MNTKLYIGICVLFLTLFTATTSRAATLTVTNKNDNGGGSLRQAVINANNGDTIIFAANLSGSIVLSTEITINKNLIISGPGVNILGIEGIGGFPNERVFHITVGVVTISSLRISKGWSFDVGGGGVLVEGGNLTINNCLLSENSTDTGSTIPLGGGGALVLSGATLTITNSTISGNSAEVDGGGVSNRGGTLSLINTTVIGNTAPRGGGVSNYFAAGNTTTTILNTTITGNRTGDSSTSNAGGLWAAANVILKNTIVANNSASFAPIADFGVSIENVSGIVNSQGNNLIGITTGNHGFIASDLVNANPLLGVLANNGGGTFTVSLLPGSPAINGGNNTGAPATDQRGVARPQGAAVDIGAFESGVNPVIFGKIAFVRNGANSEIFSMNPNGTNQVNLTNNSAFDSQPNWSPDGAKIVFVSNRASGGTNEIYTMNANGSSPTRLTNNSVNDETPAFSPDGAKIAFARSGQLFVMNADGTNVVQVTANASPGDKLHPSWSPDGTQLVFSRNLGFGNIGIAVISSACNNCTAGIRVLNNGLPTDNFEPVWAIDGTIAFSNDQVDFADHSQPHTYLLDEYEFSVPPRRLVNFDTPYFFTPAWSPDGTKLVYLSSSAGLSTINADGTNPTSLGISGNNSLPHWGGSNSPTGTNVTAISGTTSITFSGISNPGTTTVVPIDAATAGNIPSGYSLGAGFPAFEITTTAAYTAPITVCLQVPSITNPVTFNALTLFHGEGGILVDRTVSRDFATKTICASVTSLSPFVVAQNLAPTAANVSVGGRVSTAEGYGISRARISIVNQNGETRTVSTNSFGYFRFNEIPAGQTYILSVRAKGFQFDSQVLNVSEDIQNADVTALP